MANCWVGFWYLRDFGRRIKNPKVTPNSKTQCGQKGQSFSPGGTVPSLDLTCGGSSHGGVSTGLPTSEVRLLRPRRHIPHTCLSHRGGLREIRKPVLAQGKRQGPPQSAAGSLHITVYQLSHSEPPNHCHLHNKHFPFLPNIRDMDSPNQAVRGRCLVVSSPGLAGASLKAGRSPGLSSCQREVSSWSHGGCWVPPWLPIILGRRHRAPL